jgi:hypothetical protein
MLDLSGVNCVAGENNFRGSRIIDPLSDALPSFNSVRNVHVNRPPRTPESYDITDTEKQDGEDI